MFLYLLRHANADTVAAKDEERSLSEKGEAQARRIARFCAERELIPDIILTSPLVRARQTAAPVGEKLGVEIFVTPWLASGMVPEDAVTGLKEHAEFASVMIVGHEPDFSLLIAHLLGLPSADRLNVRKASLTQLDLQSIRAGGAVLRFSLPCRLM